MSRNKVYVIGQNLFFLPRIQNAASAFGYEVKQIRTESDFDDAFQESEPILVLVDLEGDGDTWPKVLEGLDESDKDGMKLIAFGPHSDVAGLAKAKELGCDPVLTKGEFTRDLPKIFQAVNDGIEG